MNFNNDENCCFIVIKHPCGNTWDSCNRNFPQEIRFKDDRFDDNWNDCDNDWDDFDWDRDRRQCGCRCNCNRHNNRRCDRHDDRNNRRRCGCFNLFRCC